MMRAMPRVSEAHLAARRQQIIDAARVCFASNGFHNTTMQDVIKEAGLSVGAFYRYFKSKEELISAIAEEVIGVGALRLAEAVRADPPLPLVDVYDVLLTAMEPQLRRDGIFPLAMQVWAESLRNPDLAAWVDRVYGRIRANFHELAVRNQAAGVFPTDVDPAAIASALFAVVPGYALQRVLLGNPDRETFLTGLRVMLQGVAGDRLRPDQPAPRGAIHQVAD